MSSLSPENLQNLHIGYEPTPNPQSMKFVINCEIAAETADFRSSMEATRSPLASKIFGFPWTDGVMIGPRTVTITKQDWVEWDVLADPLCGLIKEHLERGEAILIEAPQSPDSSQSEDDTPVVRQIKEILDSEIRPAVAMDGGDIVFSRYEDHIVYVYMQGACAGCPSSTMTLKMGIEARLREAIPEIKEVLAL